MANNPFDPPIIQIKKTLERGGLAGANRGFGSVRSSSSTSFRPAPGPQSLDELDDVDTTGIEDGQTLVWNEAEGMWLPGEGGGGALTVRGTWDEAEAYAAGDVVLHNGSTYLSTRDHAPGDLAPGASLIAFGRAVSGTPSTVLPSATNDMFADALTVQIDEAPYVSEYVNNAAATSEPGEPQGASQSRNRSLWWKYTPAVSGTATIDMDLTRDIDGTDTEIAVWTGATLDALTLKASDSDSSPAGGFRSKISNLAVTAGTTYWIQVGKWNSVQRSNTFDAVVRVTGPESVAIAGDIGWALLAQGVPAGGTTTQILAKASDDDHDMEWIDAPTGGGGGGGGGGGSAGPYSELPMALTAAMFSTPSGILGSPGAAVDGRTLDAGSYCVWGPENGTVQYLVCDLGATTTEVSRVTVVPYHFDGRSYKDLSIETSTDGVTWEVWLTSPQTISTIFGLTVYFGVGQAIRYIRYGTSGSTANAGRHIVEFLVWRYGVAPTGGGGGAQFPLDVAPDAAHAKDDEFTGETLDPKWVKGFKPWTETLTGDSLVIAPAGAGFAHVARQVAPSGAFTVTAKVSSPNGYTLSDIRPGIFVVNTAQSKALVWGMGLSGGPAKAVWIEHSNYSETADWGAYNGQWSGNIGGTLGMPVMWYRMRWDPTTGVITMDLSADGSTWFEGAATRGGWTQPDRIGFGIENNSGNTNPKERFVLHWFRVTEP